MKTSYKILIFLTLFLASFWLWLASSHNIKTWYVQNILKTPVSSVSGEFKDLDLSTFWKVHSLIKKEYYDLDGLKKEELINWATKWLVSAIWDKHSEFMTQKENEEFSKMLSWDFEWIWAVVDKIEFLWVKIERVLKWSPAEKFWLRKDDILIEANWEKLEDLNLFDAVAKIKGPAGTKVLLKVLRSGEKEALEIEVIRKNIKIPSVEEKYFKDENIWYIAINLFWDETSHEFKKALKNIEKKEAKGLIIDLRNNGWGYLVSAVEILSEFIDNWELLVTTKYKNKFLDEVYKSINIWGTFDKKIVILINGSSASASEITSWALREYNKAIIVWEKSYGKWSVQKPFILEDGSMLKLTIAKWFTPKDRNIDKEWITPDIEVKIKKQDYDLEECKKEWVCKKDLKQKDFKFYDRQLEEAKKVLQSFIKKGTLQVIVDEENERLWNNKKEKKKEEK